VKASPSAEGVDSHRRQGRRRSIGFAVLAGAAVGLGAAGLFIALMGRHDPPATPSVPAARAADVTWAPGTRPAPDFTLRNQAGRAVSLSSLRGSVVLLTFLDSRCKHLCRVEGPVLGELQQSLPAAERPVIVVVSVNPEDTAASVSAAARRWGWRAEGWYWLMGSPNRLAVVWRVYGVDVRMTPDDILHSGVLYVIDRAGNERAGYATPFDPGRVTQVVRLLVAEP
jgi:cytochrome oxidase Cu insertion factor (SCO1/SenC/PrrC family)